MNNEPQLREVEKNVLEAAPAPGSPPVSVKALARFAGYGYNSYLRGAVARLVDRGLLAKVTGGIRKALLIFTQEDTMNEEPITLPMPSTARLTIADPHADLADAIRRALAEADSAGVEISITIRKLIVPPARPAGARLAPQHQRILVELAGQPARKAAWIAARLGKRNGADGSLREALAYLIRAGVLAKGPDGRGYALAGSCPIAAEQITPAPFEAPVRTPRPATPMLDRALLFGDMTAGEFADHQAGRGER